VTTFQPFTGEDEDSDPESSNYRNNKPESDRDQKLLFEKKFDPPAAKGGSRYDGFGFRNKNQVEQISERYNEELDHTSNQSTPQLEESIKQREAVLGQSNSLGNSPPLIKNDLSNQFERDQRSESSHCSE